MKLFSRLGGLVAVVAMLMAAGSLLVAPVAGQASREISAIVCSIEADGAPAPNFTTKVTVLSTGGIGGTAATADDWVELTVSSGSISAKADGEGTASLQLPLKVGDDCANPAANAGEDDYSATFFFHTPDVSGISAVVLTAEVLGNPEGARAVVVSVTPGPTVLKVEKGYKKTIGAASGSGGTEITATLSRGTQRFGGKSVSVSTSAGRLLTVANEDCASTDDTNASDPRTAPPASNSPDCDVLTTTKAESDAADDAASPPRTGDDVINAEGQVVVFLRGDDRAGIATVTFEFGKDLSASVDIVLSGDPKTVTATAAAATMQAVGALGVADDATTQDVDEFVASTASSNLITVKVVDSNSNPVSGVHATGTVKTNTDQENMVEVSEAFSPAKSTDAPSCLAIDGSGTNSSGVCVLEVTAIKGTTLGEHVVEVKASDLDKVSVSITVVGPVESITTDAPDGLVGPGSRTEITASAADENGDAVGPNVAASAFRFAGDGAVIEPDNKVTNDDGQYVFSFLAPPVAGTTSIYIEIGGENTAVNLTIGTEPTVVEPEPVVEPVEPDPEMMAHGFSSTLGSGGNLTTYTGSIGELAMDAAEAGVSVVAVFVDGEYITYIVGAPTFANEPFSAQFPDGLDGVIVVAIVN